MCVKITSNISNNLCKLYNAELVINRGLRPNPCRWKEAKYLRSFAGAKDQIIERKFENFYLKLGCNLLFAVG
jgi:hypothetical protein